MPSFMLESERLLLRPPEAGDAATMALLMNDWDVVKNLSRAPFPYTEDDANTFIGRQEEGSVKASDFAFAITRKSDDAFLGVCGVHLREVGFELGYWLGQIGRAHV